MQQIIDVACNVGAYAQKLADLGVRSVIRYYNHANSRSLPSKCLTKAELTALDAAGLTVAVVFEAGGGAGGRLSDFSDANAARDARRALALAENLDQPHGSAIYFAVDHDYAAGSDLAQIARYFRAIKRAFAGHYRLGLYGSGTVGRVLHDEAIVELIWLSGSTGWSGTRKALRDGLWTLFQKDMEQDLPFGGIDYDGNIFNPAFADFGQFSATAAEQTAKGTGVSAVFSVQARDGLNLRAGPGETFGVLQKYGFSTLVSGLKQLGDWTQVDIQGDGAADGYMHTSYLQAESGGLPFASAGLALRRPMDVARAELALDVREIPGRLSNSRITLYHATTRGGAASDETAWCSSFINYCVEQTGLKGTDSKWARSWHDDGWGHDVTAAPQEGDIVVFSRTGGGEDGGHVTFFQSADDDSITGLGGNQGNRVSVASYPRNGVKGPYHYRLLSIRRA